MSVKNTHLRIGVDMGMTGAICFYDSETGIIIDLQDVPTRKISKTRNAIDYYELAMMILEYRNRGAGLVIIEKVHPQPTGTVGNFSMGYSKGLFHGIVASFHMPLYEIAPAKWKAHYGLIVKKGPDGKKVPDKIKKEMGLNYARHKFGTEPYLTRQKDHNRADSMLIASLPWSVLQDVAS